MAVYLVRMVPLSPLDALGPAFRRTREVLAVPFRLGFFLKITLIAALTQPSFYSATFSYPLQGLQLALKSHKEQRWSSAATPAESLLAVPGLAAFGIAFVLIAAFVGLALWVLAAYLRCRLRFTLFDLVVNKRGRVRQAWRAYGPQAWRYFGLVVLAALVLLVVAAVVAGPMLFNLVRILRPLAAAGANANPLPIIGAALPLLLALFAIAILWAVTDALMEDFLLPPMAIEDAPIESALERFRALAKRDLGSLTIYVLLRFALGIGLTGILMLALAAVFLVGGLILFALGALCYHLLWVSVAGQVFCVSLALVTGIVILVLYAVAIIAIYGTTAVFKQAYAAYFFGSRYPELGNRLEPPTQGPEKEIAEPPSTPEIGLMSSPPFLGAPPVW